MKLEHTLAKRPGPLYTAAFLDVVLLLLIFFLLSSGMILNSGVVVSTPTSESSLPPVERTHVVTVAPGNEPAIFFNEQRVTLPELVLLLQEEDREVRQVILRADRVIPFGLVMEISNAVLANGYDLAYATSTEDEA